MTWVVAQLDGSLYLRLKRAPVEGKCLPTWTIKVERARAFPTEYAAWSVIEEWGLVGRADAIQVCNLDK